MRSVIYNREAAELPGFTNPADAVGKKIDFRGEQYTIPGVVENFHQQSLREAFEPLIFRLIPDASGYLSVKTTTAQSSATIAAVKKQWNTFFPGKRNWYTKSAGRIGNRYFKIVV